MMQTRIERLMKEFKEKGYQLTIVDEPESHRQLSYWYGGLIATITDIETNDFYDIVANGDVRATYYNEDGEQEAYVKDKGNNAMFYSEMSEFITDDSHLEVLVANFDEGIYPSLEIDNNNWFELFSNYDTGNFEEVIDAEFYLDALEEALAIIIDFKN